MGTSLCGYEYGGEAIDCDTVDPDTLALACMELCDSSMLVLNRCMGISVTDDGDCTLYDRDWTRAEKSNNMMVNVSTSFAEGIEEHFPGLHLVRSETDLYVLQRLTNAYACYARVLDCSSAPDCAALNRYPCSRGKIANTCDQCKPRYADSGSVAPGNSQCMHTGAAAPTLRIAFSTSNFITDDHSNSEGFNSAMITNAYAIKHAWESNLSVAQAFIPIPRAEREDFNIEFVGFTEDILKFTTHDVGGTEEASSSSITPGAEAMAGTSGSSKSQALNLRETDPPGQPVHAVIGNYQSTASEEAIARLGAQYQTPVVGFWFEDTKFNDRSQFPYYIRSNRVALDPGLAVTQLLKELAYNRIFLMQAAETVRLADQIRAEMPTATLVVDGPAQDSRGPCSGSSPRCVTANMEAWQRLRALDARVIVHEMGGAVFELMMALGNDLLGEKTFFVQSGLPCDYIPLLDTLADQQALGNYYDAIGQTENQCVICENIARYFLSDDERADFEFVARWLYDDTRNNYAWLHVIWCPHFPTVEDLLACEYCTGTQNYFANPDCDALTSRFSEAFVHSTCVQPDLSTDITFTELSQQYITYVGEFNPDMVQAGLEATQRLREVGCPASYLEPMEPGGHLFNLGNESTLETPATYSHMWGDVEAVGVINKVLFANFNAVNMLHDAILTLIVAYNNFVKNGGDFDDESNPTRPWNGNNAAYGFKRYLLDTQFGGLSGPVEYLQSGERNVQYQLYQMIAGTASGCWLRTAFHSSVDASTVDSSHSAYDGLELRFVMGAWNFVSVQAHTDLTEELVVAPAENLLACEPFAANYFAGKIALVRRGMCLFGTKALNAQAAGAIALVVVNHVSASPVFMAATDPMLTIPGGSVGRDVGLPLIDAVTAGLRLTVTIQGSSQCVDPNYPETQGLQLYVKTMDYNPRSRTLTMPPEGITFNDGTRTAPREAPETCPIGSVYNLELRECFSCPPGSVWSEGAEGSDCVLCPAGQYWNNEGVTPVCSPCLPGTASTEAGSVECRACAAGEYAELEGSVRCNSCPPGSYSNSTGSVACTNCPVTSYQPSRGQTSCILCHEVIPFSVAPGTGTILGSQCQCAKGRYRSRETAAEEDVGECVACLEGLTCPGGLKENGDCCKPPVQDAGVHAGPEPAWDGGPIAFRVYCEDSAKCPGPIITVLDNGLEEITGRALGACRDDNAAGLACDTCKLGYVYSRSDGRCKSCDEEVSEWPIILTVLLGIGFSVAIYMYAVRELTVQSQTLMTVALTFTLSVNVIQVLGAFRGLTLDWPEPMKTIYSVLTIFTFRIELLNPGCVFSTNSASFTYLGALLMHPAFVFTLTCIFFIVGYIPPPFGRKVSLPQMVNAQGLVLLMLYISISIIALLPWQCERNPDGSSSVAAYRTVICWEDDDHHAMLVFSTFGIVAYSVGFTSVVCWATIKYPTKITMPGGIRFIRCFHFLFQRFKPERYYYGAVFTVRNLLIAVLPVIFVNTVSLQLLSLALVVATTALIQCWTQPWRASMPNYLDALASLGLTMCLMGGTMLLNLEKDSDVQNVKWFFIIIISLVTLCFIVTGSMALYLFLRPPLPYGIFLSHHKEGAAVLARWTKLLLQDLTPDGIFYDSDNLNQLNSLFEICAHQTKNVIVLLTKDTLKRIWCAGEVASAVRNNVPTHLVACQGYEVPSVEFIEKLGSIWSDIQKSQVAQLGIQIEHIQQAYNVFRDMPLIHLDRSLPMHDQQKVIETAFSQCKRLRTSARRMLNLGVGGGSSAGSTEGSILLIGQPNDPESRTVSAVILMMLQRQLQTSVAFAGHDAAELQPRLKKATHLGVVLSRGVLGLPSVASAVVAANEAGLALIPIAADSAFEYPTPEFYTKLSNGKVLGEPQPGQSCPDFEVVCEAYKAMFSNLSCRFTAHGSEKLQYTEVSEMIPRFLAAKGTGTKISRDGLTKTGSTSRDNPMSKKTTDSDAGIVPIGNEELPYVNYSQVQAVTKDLAKARVTCNETADGAFLA